MMADARADVQQLCSELLAHRSKILDPFCPLEERLRHQNVIDEFRDQSPLCVSCGLRLVSESDPSNVKFGLDMLERFIRYRWNSLCQQDQLDFRNRILEICRTMGNNTVPQVHFVKESLAKCVVEIVKKMWPQYWLKFVKELCDIGSQLLHVEVILLVYRRLIEDVTGFDNQVSGQRKSDLMTEMKSETFLSPLINYVITVLKNSEHIPQLVEIAVSTMLSVVEWIDIQYLSMENGLLLCLLFEIVSTSSNSQLQLLSCDFLIDAVARKGEIRSSAEHRKVFVNFLSVNVLEWIRRIAMNHKISNSSDEDEYLLVKKLCQFMVHIGTCQIVPLVSASAIQLPDNLLDYLLVMLLFTQHHSQLVVCSCLELWAALVTSQTLRTSEVVLSQLPQLLQVLRAKQMKVGDPEQSNHPSCIYSSFDFDGGVEHNFFFSKFKGTVNRVILTIVPLIPIQSSQQALSLVQELTQKTYPATESSVGTKNSPIFLEWDAGTSYLECWVNGLKGDKELLQKVAGVGISILETVLAFNPSDATLVLCHIKMLEGGLQNFVVYNEQMFLQKYLEKVLTYVIYPGEGIDKRMLTKEQKQVRISSLYCLTNVVKGYTSTLLPAFDQLLDHFSTLVMSDNLLFSEKCAFIETFTTLSHFRTCEDQLSIISTLLEEVVTLTNSELKKVVVSLPNIIQYLGLNLEVTDNTAGSLEMSMADNNRGKMSYCVHTVMGVLQRCTIRERKSCGAPNKTDPITSLIPLLVPLLLEFILPLIRTFHLLWSDNSKPLLSNSFQAIHSLCQYEREMILGAIETSTSIQDKMNRVLSQLIVTYDHCLMAVGFACPTFGLEALSKVGYVESVVLNVFTHLLQTKQLRLKPIIRNVMIPVVVMCPSEQWVTTLTPLLAHFCQITFNCLQSNWSNIVEKHASHASQLHEDDQVALSEEVLHHQFTIYLTRQYIQLIETVCIKKNDGKYEGGSVDMADSISMEVVGKDHPNKGQHLSDLAVFLLRSEIQQILLLSIVAPIAWLDGYTARKCINLATLAFEKMSVVEFGKDVVLQILNYIFQALQIHGEDETILLLLVVLALLIYESASGSIPEVFHLISSLSGCTLDDIEKFNRKLVAKNYDDPSTKTGKITKWKREEFKRLLSGAIGKPVGQLHKNSPVFLDLPALMVKKSHRFRSKQKTSGSVVSISDLFEPDSN